VPPAIGGYAVGQLILGDLERGLREARIPMGAWGFDGKVGDEICSWMGGRRGEALIA
jgi:hypothetical protein